MEEGYFSGKKRLQYNYKAQDEGYKLGVYKRQKWLPSYEPSGLASSSQNPFARETPSLIKALFKMVVSRTFVQVHSE
jgi:hypothetical protein